MLLHRRADAVVQGRRRERGSARAGRRPRAFHTEGRIDDPAQIARQRVATVGGKDALVPAPITRQLHGYYDAFGLPASALKPVTLDAAGHTMPTTAYGGAWRHDR